MDDATKKVDVLLSGKTLPNADIDRAAAALAKMTKLDPDQARALITGGKPKLVVRGVSPDKGYDMTVRFASLGIETVMRPSAPATPHAGQQAPPARPAREAQTPQEEPAAAQKPALPATYVNSIGMEFVLIPAGTFLMGSPEGVGNDDEHPQHQVTITRPFYLGKYPVTQAQWQAIMGKNPSKFRGPTHPVEQVSWNDVQQCIARLNAREGHSRYRLPSEAEWEYACRAGTKTRCFFGDGDEQVGESYAWYGPSTGGHTHPVGQKAPNPWGLYDMYGNVWEWVEDWYSEQTYYASSPQDPAGPESGGERVLRGGSWFDFSVSICRSAFRYNAKSDRQEAYIGFRLAMTVDAAVQPHSNNSPQGVPNSAHVPFALGNVNATPTAGHASAAAGAAQERPVAPHTAAGTTGALPSGKPMTFGDAVSTCFKKYADFSGRASRAEYWFFILFYALACLAGVVCMALGTRFAQESPYAFFVGLALLGVILLVLFLPALAVTVRRLHDTDKSGWLALLGIIPYVGPVILWILALFKGTDGPNRFGDAP